MSDFSLTKRLLSSDTEGFKRATQSTFLKRAAQGKVTKDILGQWLANDRLYILGYIQGIGKMLSFLSLPETVPPPPQDRETSTTRLLDWLIDAMVNIRREEKFFVDTAHRFGIVVSLPSDENGHVPSTAKLEGLRRFEALFGSLGPSQSPLLPWLECAVVFYGTEKCYLEAWTWARNQLELGEGLSDGGGGDADGGALRNEFIPNWTGKEFVAFVDQLGNIIDAAVAEYVKDKDEHVKSEIIERSLVKWQGLLAAEETFWPEME